MSLDQLASFVAVADHGSVSAAARALHLSQPPVSRQLLALEDELARHLFERTPRGMRLTDDGVAFLPRARAILDAVDELRRFPPSQPPATPSAHKGAAPKS